MVAMSMHSQFLVLVVAAGNPASVQTRDTIDTHLHVVPGSRSPDLKAVGAIALRRMDAAGVQLSLIMPMPHTTEQQHPLMVDSILPLAREYPDRFAVLGGGGSLNVLIQEAVAKGQVSDDLRSAFDAEAADLIGKGVVGFGEMTAEHFSMNPTHPHISAPPDHELFLRLSDLAARHNVPIDLHMEAVPQAMPLPSRLQSPPNPATLKPNIAAFERLLAHNRAAKIVWVHLGWDGTGARTAELTRRLLQAHPNLFLSVRVPSDIHASHVKSSTLLMNADGTLKPEWRAALEEFPDRFVLGSDEIITQQGRHSSNGSIGATAGLLRQLSETLLRKISSENPRRLYRLPAAQRRP
jgi:predicted TIM-barrel fold metal-dependent hydrolase